MEKLERDLVQWKLSSRFLPKNIPMVDRRKPGPYLWCTSFTIAGFVDISIPLNLPIPVAP